MNSKLGSGWLQLSKQPRLFADPCNLGGKGLTWDLKIRDLHGDVLVLLDGVDQFLWVLGGTPPRGLDQDPERLARLLRRQGLRLEVALLEEDQTLELNHTGNSQKANLRTRSPNCIPGYPKLKI